MAPAQLIGVVPPLRGREFAEAVGFFGGLPPEVVKAQELHDLLLPPMIADFQLVAGYQRRPAGRPALDPAAPGERR